MTLPDINLQNSMLGDSHVTCMPWGVRMDLAMTSYQNGTLILPMLSTGYGTLVDQTTPLDQAFLSI